jgi:hypothetical protein
MWTVEEKYGFDRDTTIKITHYLQGEGLLKFQALGGLIGIACPKLRKHYLEPDLLTSNVTNFIAHGGKVIICEACPGIIQRSLF